MTTDSRFEMDEQQTCGKGLAEHSALTASLGDLDGTLSRRYDLCVRQPRKAAKAKEGGILAIAILVLTVTHAPVEHRPFMKKRLVARWD